MRTKNKIYIPDIREPPIRERSCDLCGKKKSLKGQLYFYTERVVRFLELDGHEFYHWGYTCQWCRAKWTKWLGPREEVFVRKFLQ
jgi:hypothetical protein